MSKQRILELSEGETWTPLHESVNDLLHEEKKFRQENDANKSADVCKQIVSPQLLTTNRSLKKHGQRKHMPRFANGLLCSSNVVDRPNKPSWIWSNSASISFYLLCLQEKKFSICLAFCEKHLMARWYWRESSRHAQSNLLKCMRQMAKSMKPAK